MVLTKISYTLKGKKKHINVELANTPWKKFKGLMFKKTSPPLLFTFHKEKTIAIHSFFCRPFKAIWLDKNYHVTKVIDVKNPSLHLQGFGKYLLEIPEPPKNDKSSSENK